MAGRREEEIKACKIAIVFGIRFFFLLQKITQVTQHQLTQEVKKYWGIKSSPQSFCKLTLSLDSHLLFNILGQFTLVYPVSKCRLLIFL